MTEIRTTKIDGVEFVTYKDYLKLKEEKQELEYLGDINEELKEENIELRQKIADLQDLLEQCKVLLESLDLKNKTFKS